MFYDELLPRIIRTLGRIASARREEAGSLDKPVFPSWLSHCLQLYSCLRASLGSCKKRLSASEFIRETSGSFHLFTKFTDSYYVPGAVQTQNHSSSSGTLQVILGGRQDPNSTSRRKPGQETGLPHEMSVFVKGLEGAKCFTDSWGGVRWGPQGKRWDTMGTGVHPEGVWITSNWEARDTF